MGISLTLLKNMSNQNSTLRLNDDIPDITYTLQSVIHLSRFISDLISPIIVFVISLGIPQEFAIISDNNIIFYFNLSLLMSIF